MSAYVLAATAKARPMIAGDSVRPLPPQKNGSVGSSELSAKAESMIAPNTTSTCESVSRRETRDVSRRCARSNWSSLATWSVWVTASPSSVSPAAAVLPPLDVSREAGANSGTVSLTTGSSRRHRTESRPARAETTANGRMLLRSSSNRMPPMGGPSMMPRATPPMALPTAWSRSSSISNVSASRPSPATVMQLEPMPWRARAPMTSGRLSTKASMSDELMMIMLPSRNGRLRPENGASARTAGSTSSCTTTLAANSSPRAIASSCRYGRNGAMGRMSVTSRLSTNSPTNTTSSTRRRDERHAAGMLA
eukprot:Unigene5797_Nuclearia_a/m.17712 Unigene5797_Nuclearia_a/g.17712  ORF Unigene5797_Nuclearia_a/g.17712 Unigene5797_Nuclearia_a/m.17712 type:complete len:308 (-) Unigene5797_Nuclearia_a:15-938(-)